MAEESEDTKAEGEDAPAKKGGKKNLFIVIGVVVLLVAVGVPAAFMLMKKAEPKLDELGADAASAETPHGRLEGSEDVEDLEEGEEALGAIVPFDTFVVNLSGGKFIRVQLQVEFATLDVPRKFYSRMVPMRDAIISMLTERTPDDLESQKGKDTLKSQIRTAMNEMLHREDVKKIYFTQFVIQ
jgi:flagellar FliL protein